MNLKQVIKKLDESIDLVEYLAEDDGVSRYLLRELKSIARKLETIEKENE